MEKKVKSTRKWSLPMTGLFALFSVSKKSSNGWAFSHVDGKINMGDERCWNAGNGSETW